MGWAEQGFGPGTPSPGIRRSGQAELLAAHSGSAAAPGARPGGSATAGGRVGPAGGRGGAGGGARSPAGCRPGRRAGCGLRAAGSGQGGRPAGSGPGPAARTAMVGRLSLQDVPELVDTKKKGDGVLDSPDSGLPPSPSPSHWALAAAGGGGGAGGERAPAPGALEPDAATTPAAPVSGPAWAPSSDPFHSPAPGPRRPPGRPVGPPGTRCRRRHPPSGRHGQRREPGEGARREPGQLEPVAGKLSSPGRRGSPERLKPLPLPSGWWPPGLPGCGWAALLIWRGWRGPGTQRENSRHPRPLTPPWWLQRACPLLARLGKGVCSASPIRRAKGACLGKLSVVLERPLLSCHLTLVWHMMGGRPLGGWKR